MKEIAGVRLPDSALCQAATELAARVSEPFLFNHVMRSCIYAEWIGQRKGAVYDREILYVATVLHDLGLTPLAGVKARFEIEGADAAKELLEQLGMDDRRVHTVWDSIALHTTPEIPARKGTEMGLCQLGVACDTRGIPVGIAADALPAQVLEVYPRLEMHAKLLDTLVGLYRKNAAACSSHAVSDACERRVPGFRRFNMCDVLVEHAAQAPRQGT